MSSRWRRWHGSRPASGSQRSRTICSFGASFATIGGLWFAREEVWRCGREAELERKIGRQEMELDFFPSSLAANQGARPGERRVWRDGIYAVIETMSACLAQGEPQPDARLTNRPPHRPHWSRTTQLLCRLPPIHSISDDAATPDPDDSEA